MKLYRDKSIRRTNSIRDKLRGKAHNIIVTSPSSRTQRGSFLLVVILSVSIWIFYQLNDKQWLVNTIFNELVYQKHYEYPTNYYK